MRKTFSVLILIFVLVISLLSGCATTPAPVDTSELDKVKADLEAAKSKITELESDLEAAMVFDASYFPTWFEEEGTWRTIQNDRPENNQAGGFITDASGKPSQEDLEKMLHMASLAVTSGGRADWFMVAVTDPDEQLEIIGDRYGIATSEGTVTVLILSERLLRPDVRTDEVSTFQPDRGYYNVGIVTGYLNVAAISLGYGSHMFMTPALPGVNGFNDGDIGLDVTKYIEGTEYYMASTHEFHSTENMKFVCAVVIGTLDETVEAGVTNKEFPDNWILWD
jgi:outer membrane murein-binding lipoprotein Lpp